MQTLYVLLRTILRSTKRKLLTALIVLISVSSTLTLSACSTLQNIHVNRITHVTAPENACAKAYQLAQYNQHIINRDTTNITHKNWSATAQAWKTVSQQCPGRLNESIVYSAQAQWAMLTQQSKSEDSQNTTSNAEASTATSTEIITATQQRGHESYVQLREVLNHYKHFKWSHQPLVLAAAAEDQLAFILQALAAKKVPNLPLEYSDIAASNAQSFMHAADTSTDLRKKIYDIPTQALESGIAHDSASNKDLPLAAIAYMDCARAELAAFQHAMTITASKHNEITTLTNGNISNDKNTAMQAHQAFKDAIVQLITSRLLSAYALGYPVDASLILK